MQPWGPLLPNFPITREQTPESPIQNSEGKNALWASCGGSQVSASPPLLSHSNPGIVTWGTAVASFRRPCHPSEPAVPYAPHKLCVAYTTSRQVLSQILSEAFFIITPTAHQQAQAPSISPGHVSPLLWRLMVAEHRFHLWHTRGGLPSRSLSNTCRSGKKMDFCTNTSA